MISQYKNIKQINEAKNSVSGHRIDQSKMEFVASPAEKSFQINSDLSSIFDTQRFELHTYIDSTYITGNHKIQSFNKLPEFRSTDNKKINIHSGLGFNLYDELNNLNLTAGRFKFVINFFKNCIGSYEQQHLRIDDISPDRTELRLRAIDVKSIEYLQQITKFADLNQTSKNGFAYTYLLNFSRNNCILFVNSVVIGEFLYVKLHEALPDNISLDFKCWVVEELKPSYIDNVSIVSTVPEITYNKLANPNWQANYSYDTSNNTGLRNWTDLLGSSTQTSQQLIDSYFSGSMSGIKLNIDYTDFNNFVFYGSATERLENFKYKVGLIEYYTSQSLVIAKISGSVAITSSQNYLNLKTNLISGFDNFENYLYFTSESKLTTHISPLESPNVSRVTGSYITPAPKSNSTVPYTLYASTSSQFNNWYTNLRVSASYYDEYNYNSLIQLVPEHYKSDTSNANLLTFVNMLGQHYDIFYMYIKHMSTIHKRIENPKLGMPNELLFSVAKQFGWNLTNGNQSQELWEYEKGTSEFGVPLTGSNSIGDPSVPGSETSYAIWRRIVNNLPLLLKTKGTKRSVTALLACYGIPQSIISINEYSGPLLDRTPIYEKLTENYALDLIDSPAGTVSIPYSSPTAIELRFKTDNIIANPFMSSSVNLFKWNGGARSVKLNYVSGTMGTVCIQTSTTTGVVSSPIEMFDGNGWLTAVLQEDGANLKVTVTRAKHGKIVAQTTASFNSLGIDGSTLILGNATTPATFGYRFQGYLQELKIWNTTLDSVYINNHTTAPSSYNSPDPYNDLAFRLPLSNKINHALTASLSGSQPKESGTVATFASWTNSVPYQSQHETYYFDAPSIGSSTFDDNKIRIEDSQLEGRLSVNKRSEVSEFDETPLDSNKIGVYFSPQTMIDEDVIAQLGHVKLDNYIGNPGEQNGKSYPELEQIAASYWKKYQTKNNINSYMHMFKLFDLSFFKQLDQLLPARANKLTGILIQPNILERSKDSILPPIQRLDCSVNSLIKSPQPNLIASTPVYTGYVDKIVNFSGIDDDQYQGYLTASSAKRYNGTTYSYNYFHRSGSGFGSSKSPYWLSDAIQPTYINSSYSNLTFTATSTTHSIVGGFRWIGSGSQIQSTTPTGIANHRYKGSKLTAPGFNVNSNNTIEGFPVVESIPANPNQLIYQSLSERGSFSLI